MAIEPELMRSCIIEALRRNPQTQYEHLKGQVATVLNERDLPTQNAQPMGWASQPALRQEDLRRFRETISALIVEGVVTYGINDSNAQWPWLSLTEYGEDYAQRGQLTPYDPSGYLAKTEQSAPLDPTERRYLPQALEAFRKGLPDAAAGMLGATSEHLLIQLGEAIEQQDQSVAQTMRARLDGPALPLLRELRAYFEARVKRLPRPLQEGLGTTFAGVADLIRATRNDAGHPRLDPVTREQVFISLQLFPRYSTWIHGATAALPI